MTVFFVKIFWHIVSFAMITSASYQVFFSASSIGNVGMLSTEEREYCAQLVAINNSHSSDEGASICNDDYVTVAGNQISVVVAGKIIAAIDILCVIFFFFFSLVLNNYITSLETVIDNRQHTTADYAVMVDGLPEEAQKN